MAVSIVWFSWNHLTQSLKFTEKEEVVGDLCLHHAVLLSLAELEQMKRGLEIQKFSVLMNSYPHLLRKAFHPPTQSITSDFIQDLFVPSLSPQGSNRREKEEAIMMAWIRYLQNIEGKYQIIQARPGT